LIALISNARRFHHKTERTVGKCAGFPATRLDEHCSERPEVEINPDEAAVAAPCARAPHRPKACAPGVSPLYDVHDPRRSIGLPTRRRNFVLFND
jgi:hypothetical protein